MSCIHYKFRSSLEYDTLTFDGLAISLADLKKSIMAQKKFAKVTDFDLEVTNAQTKEEYKDDTTQIPKNSSVIVRRIPTGTRSKAQLAADRADPFASGLPKTKNDLQELQSNVSIKQNKVVDLVSSDASEEDKLKAMMSQAGEDWQPNQYVRGRGRGYNPSGPLPPNYVCYRCGKPGHFIRNCPTNGVKRTIGIPRKFGEEADSGTVDDSNKETKKETSDSTKKMVPVPEIDVSKKDRKVPSELKCPMCRNLLTDAVLIPCCGTSYCDECIRTYLLENEQVCPTCGAEDVSPDSLIINKQLRQAVNNFRNARPASPFVNSTTVDKPVPSTSADKPTPNGSTIDKPVTSNTNALKVPSTTVPDSTPQSATPDVHSTDTSDKEKSEQKVSSTTSEPPQKEIPEVKENVKKKESSPLVFKAEVSSPKKDQFNDDHHHHKAPAREHLRTGTRSAGVHTSQHPGSISSYGHHDHPVHRGPPHGHNIGHPINEPLMHRTVPPEGALFVPPIRPPRPLLTQAHPGPLMPRPGFISSAPIGLHPSIVHAPLRVEPNLLGGPLPFGVNPSGFHPFENPMHGTGGLPPMSEEEFYRYQRKMKRNKRLKQREKEKSSRRERSSNHGQPGNFDDELSQYKAIQRHRTRPRSRSRSYSRSRSRSHSNSRSFSRSLSHSSHSLSKSPTPEDWDRSRTPSPVDSPTKSGSKSPNNEEKKPKHKKRKKHHKHKHSKKQKSTENEDSETKVKEKIQKGENEKTEKKKSKSKKRSKDKEKTSKNKKKTSKETSERTQVNSEESITEMNESENSEKETPIEKVNENLEESLKTDEGKLKELNVETEQDYEESRLEIEVNEKEKSRKRKSDERKSEEDGAKRKSKEKSGDKKHKKKKHKRKHKRHKKEKEKTSSQSAEGNNESTEETQEDSEEENGKDQSVKD